MPYVDYYRYLGCTITHDMSPNSGLTGILQKVFSRYVVMRAALNTDTLRFRINSCWTWVVALFLGAPIFLDNGDPEALEVMDAILLRVARMWLGISTKVKRETVYWMLGTCP
jgi:hypothetical protein